MGSTCEKSVNEIYNITRRNTMIISIDAEDNFDKRLHPFIIRTLRKQEIEGNFLILYKIATKKNTTIKQT